MSIHNQILTFTQIALETLPISSSAHVIIIKKLYSTLAATPTFFAEYFYQLCNIPTLIVLIFYFRQDLSSLIFNKEENSHNLNLKMLQLFGSAFLSSCITTGIYFLSKKTPPYYQFVPTHPLLIIPAMLTTALLLLSLKLIKPTREKSEPQMNFVQTIILGFVQAISLTPGISRFASTYVTCRWFGNTTYFSLRYSFLLHSILTSGLLARAVLFRWQKTVTVLASHFSWATLPVILAAMLTSFWLLKFADFLSQKNKLWILSIYLILPISATMLLWIFG